MATHAYWRLTGFLTDNGVLELSQARLYNGVTLLADAPAFTFPPASGTAFPDTLYWDDCTKPGFALVWHLATAVEVPSLQLGAGGGAASFPKDVYLQYSDDGQFWSTTNTAINVTFPGAGLLTVPPCFGGCRPCGPRLF